MKGYFGGAGGHRNQATMEGRRAASLRATTALTTTLATTVATTVATALVTLCLGTAARADDTQGAPLTLGPVSVQGSAAPAAATEGYAAKRTTTATKTDTPLTDVPQSITVVPEALIKDQAMQGIADVVRYVPGVTASQGENNRDQLVIRGNSTTADFFVDGVRDDAQYFRDLYNVDRVEVLKGSNAMIFGRGGGGGVVNRALKEADGSTIREIGVQAGSFENKRATVDLGQALTADFAARLNAMYENSKTFRDYGKLERMGINPTLSFTPTDKTRIKLGYEYFRDERTADRGVPSYRGRPLDTDISTFFGNPKLSNAEVDAHAVDGLIEHDISDSVTLRNRSRFAHYDKFYQNIFPGAVNAAGTTVALSGYNNSMERTNLFNQTDLITKLTTGPVKHTLLTGVELGRQETDSFRNTAFFAGNATSLTVPIANPVSFAPVTFRQSATDANARTIGTVAAAYVQDQIELNEQWQVIGGLRFDSFDIDFHNNRNGQDLDRRDNLLSPRVGLVFKPIKPLSLYASYSVSYLPSSGDQFSSLTTTTTNLKPEKFENLEVGAKWEVQPNLYLTTALFQLERSNTAAPDPNNPGFTVQTGKQRTRGLEVGISGNITDDWQIAGGYALQDAEITSQTSAAAAGASVALVPRQTFSLWNKYQFTPVWGAGVGVIHQTSMYAAVDNAVVLPGFTRFDAAVYANVMDNVRAQLNVQNLFDRKYYATASGNNNISPGAPRTFLVSLNTKF
ncbi:TonB-dependent receptor [Azospirillum sp. sgz302134]